MHKKRYLICATIFGATAVAIGAFGTHGLQQITSDEKILHGFQTGVNYQFIHTLALLATGILSDNLDPKWSSLACKSFVTGILLFSGSLYILAWLKIQESSMVKLVGPVTPLGGILFIAGWLFLLLAILKKK